MSYGSKGPFKVDPVSFTNTHHDVTDLLNHWLEYLEYGTYFFFEIKKSSLVRQMTHLEKLSSCSGGNLQRLKAVLINVD